MGGTLDRLSVGRRPSMLRTASASEPLRHADFSLFGIPLAVRSNDEALLATLAGFCDASPNMVESDVHRLDLRLIVDPTLSGSTILPSSCIDNVRLVIRGRGFVAGADAAASHGFCRLSPGLRDDPDQLRDTVLEPLLLFLVTRQGRTPLHAAAFLIDDLAVLLAGPSGAGKSCLTMAAHRAGFTPLSDDIVFVATGPCPIVWGLPRPIHLFPEDVPGSDGPLRLRHGKLKHAVMRGGDQTPRCVDRAVLCLLRFGDVVALEPLDTVDALHAFAVPEPGFDLLTDEIAVAVAALARWGVWSLTLSGRPDEAIALLADNLPLLRGAG